MKMSRVVRRSEFTKALFGKRLNQSCVYQGLEQVLKPHSKPQNCRKKWRTSWKGHFYLLRQALVCTKPWFKRELRDKGGQTGTKWDISGQMVKRPPFRIYPQALLKL